MPPPAPPGTGAAPPRKVEAGQGAAWWGEAWRIFLAAPGTWIGILVLFAVLSIALLLVPLVGSLVHTLLTPVFAGGIMLGCDALARGEPLRVGHLFEGFRRGRFGPLMTLGVLWLAILFVIAAIAVGGVVLVLGASGLAALMSLGGGAQIDLAVLASAGVTLIAFTLIAATLALLAAMAYWFAPALVVLSADSPLSALQKSFAANCRNIGAFLVYGIVYLGLAIAATIPLGLGWLVFAPMIAGSCYAGWRTIFGR